MINQERSPDRWRWLAASVGGVGGPFQVARRVSITAICWSAGKLMRASGRGRGREGVWPGRGYVTSPPSTPIGC